MRYHITKNKTTGIARDEKMTLYHLGEILGCNVGKWDTSKGQNHSNKYNIWFIHSKYKEMKKMYLFEEWVLFQNLSRVKHCILFEHSTMDTPTCSDYNNGILAVGTMEGLVKVFQIQENLNANCVSVITTHTKEVLKVILAEKMLVSCSQDCSLTVIKFLDTGSLLVSHILQGHVSRVRCISLYGDQILSGSDDRSAKLWSASSSSSTALTTLSGHAWPVTQVCLSRQLAITADSCSVRVWSLPDGIILQTLGDQANVVEMLIDPRSQLLLLCDSKGDVKSINIRKNSDNKNNDQDKKLKWSRKQSDPSGKLSSKLLVGYSTMIHVTFCSTRCGSVDINILDFLC